MQAHTVFHGYAGEAEGIVLAQVLLGGEGQSPDIVERLDVVGRNAQLGKAAAVELGVHAVTYGMLQALQLQAFQLWACHRLQLRIEVG